MSHGTLLRRLLHGTRWVWLSDDYRAALPKDLDRTVMDIESSDRHHAKQGRATARVRFDSAWGTVSVYLKRHYRLPLADRLGALLDPRGYHSPASAEWAHLERARKLGISVPEVVAAGEEIGPWGRLRSFLMVAELTGCLPLHEAIPNLEAALMPSEFARIKRELIVEMARIVARLHRKDLFHKDLYLCHFFMDPGLNDPSGKRLTLIDLHRLGEHHWTAPRWRWKDLGQLLFSTYGVEGIDDHDRLQFWRAYRRAMKLRLPAWERRRVVAKAARYLAHNSG